MDLKKEELDEQSDEVFGSTDEVSSDESPSIVTPVAAEEPWRQMNELEQDIADSAKQVVAQKTQSKTAQVQQKAVHQPKQVQAQQSKSEKATEDKPTLITRLKSLLLEYKRVLRATKKPDSKEFLTVVKVSGVGILVIGFIGFVIAMIKELVF